MLSVIGIVALAGFVVAAVVSVWAILEILVRVYVGWSLETGFYSSIPRDAVSERQARYGVRVASGPGWAHLGWIADPRSETYRIEREIEGRWEKVGEAEFGSYLLREAGRYRVWAQPKLGTPARLLGSATVELEARTPPLCVPRIDGPWQVLFRPKVHGDYINDHTIYRDAKGDWRLVGITGKGDGNYADETYFAVGVSGDFPPDSEMRETSSVAAFGELAWAPHVVTDAGAYYMFWSPHRLHRMTSSDGITWEDHRIVMPAPFHKFFRDCMVLKVAEGQWLLYATGRGVYFSRVDVYQSFDLEEWQYIGPVLRTGWRSERNSAFASTESPTVVAHEGRYYLALTYNNDSFFWSALMLPLKIWLSPPSYNETLVFHADNPYDFGLYNGRHDAPSLVTSLEAHAPEFVLDPERRTWYITTAGWPWVATLTSGEVAVAPLRWDGRANSIADPPPPSG